MPALRRRRHGTPDGPREGESLPLRLLLDGPRARGHALAVDGQGDLLSLLDPGVHFGKRPVCDPHVETTLFENAGSVVDEDAIPFAQRLGRDTNDVLVRLQNDLDVRAIADEQGLRVGGIRELDFDIDRAGLLFDIDDVRRDTPHASWE